MYVTVKSTENWKGVWYHERYGNVKSLRKAKSVQISEIVKSTEKWKSVRIREKVHERWKRARSCTCMAEVRGRSKWLAAMTTKSRNCGLRTNVVHILSIWKVRGEGGGKGEGMSLDGNAWEPVERRQDSYIKLHWKVLRVTNKGITVVTRGCLLRTFPNS